MHVDPRHPELHPNLDTDKTLHTRFCRTLLNECDECVAEEGSPGRTPHHDHMFRHLLVPMVQRLSLDQVLGLN